MRIALIALGGLVLVAVAMALWVRLAPSDPGRWHVDPATTADPVTPNFARVDRLVALPLAEVAARIATAARRDGAVRLAGDDRHGTWIARSRRMGFPDYISLRLTPEGEGTRLQALSRSRFGSGDLGVNAARLARWLPD